MRLFLRRHCLVPLERLGLHFEELSNDDPTKEFQTKRQPRQRPRGDDGRRGPASQEAEMNQQ